jgi:hypothetical protein
MEKKLQDFLNSGLLERYLVGESTEAETSKVEVYLTNYPEIKEEYDLLQDQLELTAKAQAVQPSKNMLESILHSIDDTSVVKLNTRRRMPYWMSVAASIAAIAFAVTTYMYYSQNKVLELENNVIADEIFDLRNDIEQNNNMLNDVMKKLIRLDNPETQKYLLRGNNRAEDLKAVAYINPVEKSSLIDVVSLPELSDDECYQMWAQMQDKMINLGILDNNNRNLKSVPYIEDALSLSITIEPKGGNSEASLENSVAEIPLKTKDN